MLGIQRAALTGMRAEADLGVWTTLKDLDYQTVISVILTLILSCRRIYEVITLFKQAKTISMQTADTPVDGVVFKHFIAELMKSEWLTIFNYIGASLYIVTVLYAVVKLWAVFYCPSSLWNMALIPSHGCVILNETRFNLTVNLPEW